MCAHGFKIFATVAPSEVAVPAAASASPNTICAAATEKSPSFSSSRTRWRIELSLRVELCAVDMVPVQVFLAFPPPPPLLLFSFNLPSRLADAADALSGMVNFDLLLLLLLPRVMPRDGHLQCLEPLAHSPILFCVSSSACFFLTTARILREALSNICLAAIIVDNVNDMHFLAKLWAVRLPCFAVRLSLYFGLFIRHSTPCSHEAKQAIPCTLESSKIFKILLGSGNVQLLCTGTHQCIYDLLGQVT
jgi:hypothetical protein